MASCRNKKALLCVAFRRETTEQFELEGRCTSRPQYFLTEARILMSKYRNQLPLLEDRFFMTDGGLETSLIFRQGVELPYFASYDLLKTETGTALIESHYERFTSLAREHGVGIVLATPTWRASRDWGRKLGYSDSMLADANRRAVDQLAKFRSRWETPATSIVIVGTIGPRGDGYQAGARMTASQAQAYHQEQIDTFAATQVDMAGG